MEFISDLHLHSRYSRACSGRMNAVELASAAVEKGLNLLGTGDFTHPKHLSDLKTQLTDAGDGFYRRGETYFVLTSEISLMYSQDGKGRRVHIVTLAPSFEVVDQINERLAKWGRLDYDGRPIFGKTAPEYADLCMSISKDIEIIPAHCFLPKTEIVCNFHSKYIEDITEKDYVMTHKGNFERVTHKFTRPYNGIVYSIIPWYAREGAVCTPEHPFYAIKTKKKCPWTKGTCRTACSKVSECKSREFEEYNPKWTPAEELEIGDVLLYPRFKAIKDVKEINTKNKFGKVKSNPDFWRFIGYYLAEGYSNRQGGIGFALHKDEKGYAEDIIKLVFDLFGIKSKKVHKERENIEFAFYSKDLMLFLEDFCYSSKDKGAFTKSLPNFVLSLPHEKQAELLRGWWRGDKGYTISPKLKEQMKQICLRLGIIPSISVDPAEEHEKRGKHFIGSRKIKANYDLYAFSNLSFFDDEFNLLSDNSFKKFRTKRKTRHGWIDKNYVYLPIRKVNKSKYNGLVFNLEVEKDNSYVTAIGAVHNCWTPWFGMLGSMSGFNSVEECFGEKSKYIHALETGMSSDPAMNWRLSSLDRYSLVSFSDSHSPYPWRLGREATIFDLEKPDYSEMIEALRNKGSGKLKSTIETNPAYGKYHYDGHRACNVSMSPQESAKVKNICPVCRRLMTIGVENRVEELADRPMGFRPEGAHDFKSLLPLGEIVAGLYGAGLATKKVQEESSRLVSAFGSELNVLLKAPEKALTEISNEKIVQAIIRNRAGEIKVQPGYDGEYGVPIFDSSAAQAEEKPKLMPRKQKTLEEF
ncbi:MAG: hypothetical protein V1911_02255 [Candidatus Micrarchaeota archaeon]